MAAVPVDLVRQRLLNQRLVRSRCRTPEEVVSWLGAVQSQDYSGAAWALGQRAATLTAALVGQAFDAGRILRTHVMRPTWHFVAPADIRWMLELTAPRLHARNGPYYRRNGLDGRVFARSRAVLERALRNSQTLTRTELASVLRQAGISAAGEKLAYLMMHAELDGVVSSGPRRGKQFTYMLLAERAPDARRLDREAAVAELARRYFASHGPATIRDFVWWSGLTARDARAGLDANKSSVVQEVIGERTYWYMPSRRTAEVPSPGVYLFPNYDEFLIAYKDRGLSPPSHQSPAAVTSRDLYAHHLVIDGRLRGSWRRTAGRTGVRIDVQTYAPLSRAEAAALQQAAERCGRFMGLPAMVVSPAGRVT